MTTAQRIQQRNGVSATPGYEMQQQSLDQAHEYLTSLTCGDCEFCCSCPASDYRQPRKDGRSWAFYCRTFYRKDK